MTFVIEENADIIWARWQSYFGKELNRNKCVWISGKWWTYVMWFSIACYAYTIISLIITITVAVGK